ncbi:ethanolamine utilization protein EutJ [Tessaracoccus lapidicaptus]|uniref:Ethanolamine utilization protein EutJ n=1 Tax=Tessaracoccus lapidicaptus TaxID=1427523 RepID=A0A1C0AKL4_9ACTN|nr:MULTISPECIES: ethanolamine utilization protein EutJ [Tessaracoccus]AQX16860.1 ethanolamine utilization protein EutJ [Tessaracoccus sp. T2.5-30]OCL33078.1 ethanolamine utilization protein EutJ [Tessaracoccus lapidicaptus]VEP41649.1 Chaperone protein dnaK2 [Tessaracoccus lapidicaptus]
MSVEKLMRRAARAVKEPAAIPAGVPIRVGVDLGTAFTVIFVTDEHGQPLAGATTFADVVRDGVVWDFAGAQRVVRELREKLERATGRSLHHGAVTIPPAVDQSNHRAHRYVIEGAGIDCDAVVDETTAANTVLGIRDGAVVDIGGGTTGIAILEDGEIVANYDEPSGGTHMSLVLAGALKIPYEEAEKLKRKRSRHAEFLPIVSPVLEKVSTIVSDAVRSHNVQQIVLAGGTSSFTGIEEIMTRITGVPSRVAPQPMLVTPLGVTSHAHLITD